MIPDPDTTELGMKCINGPNQLPATTFAYRILKMFMEGTMQRALQEMFQVKAKQLTLCITGRHYLGEQTIKLGGDKHQREMQGHQHKKWPGIEELSFFNQYYYGWWWQSNSGNSNRCTPPQPISSI